MGQVLDLIWELPWYKVMCIAVIDDVILLIKLWPVYAVIIGITIVMFIVAAIADCSK